MSSGYVVPLLGIALVVLIYVLYLYTYGQTASVATEVNLNAAPKAIDVTASPQTTRFAVGTWVFINTWNNTNSTNIMTYTCGGSNVFSLDLAQSKPTLNLTLGSKTVAANTIAVRENFPLQKWSYVVFSVDNTFVDIYLDGKLVKSVQLNQAMTFSSSTTPQISFGNADIMLAKVYRWTNPLAPNDVWNEYLKGNGQSWNSTSYGVNLGLLQNGQETTSMRIL